MFFHFSVFFFSLVFALGLEFFVWKNEFRLWAVSILPLAVFWGGKKIGKKWGLAVVPFIFVVAALSLLYLIDNVLQKHLFVVLSAFLFYILLLGIYRIRLYEKDQTAHGMIAASSMAALFFFYTAFYGIYLNFAIPLWVLMSVFFLVTIIVSYQYFAFIKINRKRNFLYCLILGLAMAEISWSINFWPFGYLTTGVVVLMIYYVMWDLIQSYFLDILSKRRIIANMIFFGVLSSLVLASSRWFPAV